MKPRGSLPSSKQLRHLSLSWGRWIQSTSSHPISPESIQILPSILLLGLPSDLFAVEVISPRWIRGTILASLLSCLHPSVLITLTARCVVALRMCLVVNTRPCIECVRRRRLFLCRCVTDGAIGAVGIDANSNTTELNVFRRSHACTSDFS